MSNSARNDNLIAMVDVGETLYQAERKKKKADFIRVLIIGLCVTVILLFEALFVTFYTGIYIIDGSMTPTLTGATSPNRKGGDYIYINTHAKPKRGDIVVVYSPNATNSYTNKLIKRVVAFGGEWVELEEGVLKINGEIYKEDYLDPDRNSPDDEDNTFGPHKVAEGCMFLLGDNRNDSKDSRSIEYGDIPMKNLIGVVPEWSLRTKSVSTALYTFFHFTLFSH